MRKEGMKSQAQVWSVSSGQVEGKKKINRVNS